MSYDLIVIGTGPGGYVCAIRAAQLGLKTAVVEKNPTFGGTCLNVGCIPSKALLHASHMFSEASYALAPLGVMVDSPRLDLAAMMKHKDATVAANVSGVAFLLKKNGVDAFIGAGKLIRAEGDHQVEVTAADGSRQTLSAKNVVIATGSAVAPLRDSTGAPIEIDEKQVLSSTGALSLPKAPKSLTIVGAGVIGLELGSVWRRLGARVTVIEFLDRILPGFDLEVAQRFQKILEKQGFAFRLSSKVTSVVRKDDGATVTFAPVEGGGEGTTIDADAVLIATGRIPYIDGLGLAEAGVASERGRVLIDDNFATNVPGVYAIGDVVRGPMLAHKAEEEGVAVAEILAGQHGHVDYRAIPGVVYTMPEIASVGLTEEEARAKGASIKIGKFPFTANGRARAMRETEGFVKIIADAATDQVLGVHILGAGAGELIAEACVLMAFSGSAEDLARICHAHPTMSEAVKEAALAVDKRAIHI